MGTCWKKFKQEHQKYLLHVGNGGMGGPVKGA